MIEYPCYENASFGKFAIKNASPVEEAIGLGIKRSYLYGSTQTCMKLKRYEKGKNKKQN